MGYPSSCKIYPLLSKVDFPVLEGEPSRRALIARSGDPYGTRTRVARMKTWSPRPLDEGVYVTFLHKNGDPYGTRTRVARMKTWSPRPLDEGVVGKNEGVP